MDNAVDRNAQQGAEIPAFARDPPAYAPAPSPPPAFAAAAAAAPDGNFAPAMGPPGVLLGEEDSKKPVDGDGAVRNACVKGPIIIIMIVAYAIVSIWDFATTFYKLSDPNSLVVASAISLLIFDGSIAALVVPGFIAMKRNNVPLMGVYVWSMILLALLSAALIGLAAVSPMPQALKDEIDRANNTARTLNLPVYDSPSEADYKFRQSLGAAAQFGFHVVITFFARRYYLGAKTAAAKISPY